MKLKQIIEDCDTDNLIDITDQFDLKAYIKVNNSNKKNSLMIRIYKEGVFDGCGINCVDFKWKVDKKKAVDGLVDITKNCFIAAFVDTCVDSGKEDGSIHSEVILGIGKKKDIITFSTTMGKLISPKVLKHLDENWKFKC